MLTSVYGSSEYSQAFSRIGSLFGNVYIVNTELEIENCQFEKDEATGKLRFKSIEYNYNKNPVESKHGVLVGSDYQDWLLKQAGVEVGEDKLYKERCMHLTIITTQPFREQHSDRIATFVYPPLAFKGENGVANLHPIRVFQFSQATQSCPRDHYVIMAIM